MRGLTGEDEVQDDEDDKSDGDCHRDRNLEVLRVPRLRFFSRQQIAQIQYEEISPSLCPERFPADKTPYYTFRRILIATHSSIILFQ